MVKPELFAYIAGLIDGEGCISIRKVRQYGRHDYFKPMIEVGMKEQALLCLELCKHIMPRNSPHKRWNPEERIRQDTIRGVLFSKMYSLNHIR